MSEENTNKKKVEKSDIEKKDKEEMIQKSSYINQCIFFYDIPLFPQSIIQITQLGEITLYYLLRFVVVYRVVNKKSTRIP